MVTEQPAVLAGRMVGLVGELGNEKLTADGSDPMMSWVYSAERVSSWRCKTFDTHCRGRPNGYGRRSLMEIGITAESFNNTPNAFVDVYEISRAFHNVRSDNYARCGFVG